jgi:hypothetical protein
LSAQTPGIPVAERAGPLVRFATGVSAGSLTTALTWLLLAKIASWAALTGHSGDLSARVAGYTGALLFAGACAGGLGGVVGALLSGRAGRVLSVLAGTVSPVVAAICAAAGSPRGNFAGTSLLALAVCGAAGAAAAVFGTRPEVKLIEKQVGVGLVEDANG